VPTLDQQRPQPPIPKARLLPGQWDPYFPPQAVGIGTKLIATAATVHVEKLASVALAQSVVVHDAPPRPAVRYKLQPFFSDHRLQSFPVQAQIGHQRLQAPILFLERPQPPHLIHVQAAVLGSPVIQRLAGDRRLSRQILRPMPGFELLDGVNHLFFGEFGLP